MTIGTEKRFSLSGPTNRTGNLGVSKVSTATPCPFPETRASIRIRFFPSLLCLGVFMPLIPVLTLPWHQY